MSNEQQLAREIFTSMADLIPVLSLIAIAIFCAWAAVKMQVNGTIKWQDGFTDANGSVDLVRVGTFVSLIASTWWICDLTLNVIKANDGDWEWLFKMQVLYLCIWSGATVVNGIIEIARMRYGMQPNSPPPSAAQQEQKQNTPAQP